MKPTIEFFKRFGFIIFIVVVFMLFVVMVAKAQEPHVKDAMRLIETEQPGKAIESLKKDIDARPDAALYYYLGYAQLRTGEYDQANLSFDKGISLSDKSALNYTGKGHVSILKKNPVDVKTFLDRALNLSKAKDVAVLQATARAYLDDPLYLKDAIAILDKAKLLDDTNPETYMLLGDAHFLENNGGLAVSSYEGAAQYDPKDPRPHYKIGLVYLRSHDFQIAEESFLKALSIDPQYTLACKELGELYYMKKDGHSAVKYYEKYLALTEHPESGQLRYAFFLLMAKEFAKANDIFGKLILKPEVSSTALRYYAFSLFESGNYEESKKVFDQYFSKVKEGEAEASDFTHYGKLLLKLNQDSLALINFKKSLAIEKNQPGLLQMQAETYFKRKQYQEAIQSYNQLRAGGQKFSSSDYYLVGRAYYFNKQYPEADTTFLRLIELQPNMTVGYLWEARTKSNLDPESEKGLAKPYYQKVIEMALSPTDKNRRELIEAYSYMGYYQFLQKDLKMSKSYWAKVLELDPQDEKAREAVKAIP